MRSDRLAQTRERFHIEQRSRIRRLDGLAILGSVAFACALIPLTPWLAIWATLTGSQGLIAVAMRERSSTLRGTVVERWWSDGSAVTWALLPLMVATQVQDPEVGWIITIVLVFGLASDAVYLPQTFQSNLIGESIAYAMPSIVVLAWHGQWPQILTIIGFLLHVTTGSSGLVAAFNALIERQVDADLAEIVAREQSRHDDLTGIVNRQGLVDALTDLRDCASTEQVHCCFIDLDDFKLVNDRYGYFVGDDLLRRFSHAVQAAIPEYWTVGRFGGDEFVAIGATGDVEGIADQLNEIRIGIGPQAVRAGVEPVGASVGAASMPVGEVTAEELFLRASSALQEAKRTGRHQVVVSHDALRRRQRRRQTLALEVETALNSGSFVAYGQPQVDLETGRPIGLELLARWERDDELIGPNEFLPLVERTALAERLDEVMGRHALSALESLRDHGLPDVTVSLNIGTAGLLNESSVAWVVGVLQRREIDPRSLVIEITEALELHRDPGGLRALHRLRDAGIGLSIDDFGTGYSSMTQLLKVPFTEMKLDMSLVQAVGSEGPDDLLRTLAEFGRRNGFHVVAEGIESEPQRQAIRLLGIDSGQGYHFGRPEPVDRVITTIVSSGGLADAA